MSRSSVVEEKRASADKADNVVYEMLHDCLKSRVDDYINHMYPDMTEAGMKRMRLMIAVRIKRAAKPSIEALSRAGYDFGSTLLHE